MAGVLSTLNTSNAQQAFAGTTRRVSNTVSPDLLAGLFSYIARNKALIFSTASVATIFAAAVKDQPSINVKQSLERIKHDEKKGEVRLFQITHKDDLLLVHFISGSSSLIVCCVADDDHRHSISSVTICYYFGLYI